MTTFVLKNLIDKYAAACTEHDAFVKSMTKIVFKLCGLLRKPNLYQRRQQLSRAYSSNSYTVPKRPRTWPPKTIYEKPSEFSTVMAMDISQGMK